MKITFLGTGTSHGVPTIDCMAQEYAHCPKGVCKASADDPLHRRTRSSIIVEHAGRIILIDVSPDFRQQVLREKISRLDAVLITHRHADHIGGVPDIRSYTRAAPLPVYGSTESIASIRQTFSYIFDPATVLGGGIPRLETTAITGAFTLFGLTITPIPVDHAGLSGCLGFRINDLAYIPDLKTIPAQSKNLLGGLQCLILDALRDERPHATHIILPESIALARDLKPGRCYFTHFCHDIHYQRDAHYLDPWMFFGHDGLVVAM
jgi:phosphoribosyl 1,2-cyclic phosphate phosphodiesterase